MAEIASKETGIEGGARRVDVKAALEARPDLFHWEGGADHGRSARAVVWALVPTSGTGRRTETAQQSQKEPVPALWDESEQSDRYEDDLPVPAQRDEWDGSKSTTFGDPTRNLSHPNPYRGEGTGTESRPDQPVPDSGTGSTQNGAGDQLDDEELERLESLVAADPPDDLDELAEARAVIPAADPDADIPL